MVSFFAPAIPTWFTIDVDRRTWRTLQLEMIGAAHFIHHRYTGFDAPTRVEPPRDRGAKARGVGCCANPTADVSRTSDKTPVRTVRSHR